jgi:hypothetical protein
MGSQNRASLFAVAIALCVGPGVVRADIVTSTLSEDLSGSVTQSGSLPNQSDVFEQMFTTRSNADFEAFTTSYGGGANSNGTVSAAGGFQPNLGLYTSSGAFVAGQSVTSPAAQIDPATGLALDSFLTKSNLSAGSYILVISDWLNQQSPSATNLSDGFVNYGTGNAFLDAQLNGRNGDFTLDISSAAVPEPATFWLAGGAVLLSIGLLRRHGRSAAAAADTALLP